MIDYRNNDIRNLRNNYGIANLAIPTTGLVGWWKFDEGTGLSTVDSSGNGNTGTLVGGTIPAPVWVTGKFGNALDFNNGYIGGGGVVTFPNSASLNFVNTFAICTWLYPKKNDTSQSEYCYLTKRVWSPAGTEAMGLRLEMRSGGAIRFVTYDGVVGNWNHDLTTTTTIPLNQWSFVVCQIDGTNKQIYIGTPPGTLNLAATITPTNFVNGNGLLSTQSTSQNVGFVGSEDQIRVYNTNLSLVDITDIYNEGSCPAPNPGFSVS